ncbi:aspartic proteinase CDR1-like [Phalaenopsis equestris]|uniref:aspartic proteinase CDR1-like n=1 Tax=Phalaenopsis equestris TaxID=78828 RepID=UPI0009E52254|nr:aspartic proteinase CDR1-like [Phalaenopsis equestris]
MAPKLLSFSFLLLLLFPPLFASISPLYGFTIELIHKDSLLQPTTNLSAIPHLRRLLSKASHALSRSQTLSSPSTIISPIIPPNASHLMRFSIGTPPVQVLAVMDTGSDLTWLRCLPCSDCLTRKVHLFNPFLSSSFQSLPPTSQKRKLFNPTASAETPFCSYEYCYGDGSFSSGILSTETLTFESTNGEPISIPDMIFGCGYNNSPSFDGELFGLAGLGGMSFSLASQISKLTPDTNQRFSYCLSPFQDNTSTSFMNFGAKAVVSGRNVVSTPLVEKEDKTFYFVTLEAISIGGRKLDVRGKEGGEGNMFIDSGTTVSLIKSEVFEEMGDVIGEVMGLPWKMDAGNTFKCYEGRRREVFPDITFQFAGGAEVVLRPLNAFTVPSEEGLVCLAMQGTNGTAIFGNMAQQNLHIGFDVGGRKVDFKPADCAKLRR